jgi:transporter family protein
MDKSFLFAILAAVIWGFAPALEKIGLRGAGGIDPFLGVFIRTIPIALFAMIGVLVMGRLGEVASVDLRSALFVAAGGLVAGLIGQFAFYSALKWGEASVVVPVAATYPLVALLVSVLFLGEAFTMQKLAGIILVVGGVALLR